MTDLKEHLTEAIESARDAFREDDGYGDFPEHWDSSKGVQFLTNFLLNNSWVYQPEWAKLESQVRELRSTVEKLTGERDEWHIAEQNLAIKYLSAEKLIAKFRATGEK